jgi:endonuclease/exonuclease/phosphatase family metal-dependent hydrolase
VLLFRLIVGVAGAACLFSTLAQADAPRLRVATYNIWGLPSPLLRHGERFTELPASLDALEADIVLIQEAFTGKARALTKLERFPYAAWGPRASFGHFSSGLLILSRYPIVDTARIVYPRCGGFDCFANKGALFLRVLVPGVGPISVFNTHLNANQHTEVRDRQIAHLMTFIHAFSQGLPTIVGGDFNDSGRRLLAGAADPPPLRDAHFEFAGAHPALAKRAWDGYTADPRNNPFLDRAGTLRRLDHIFLLDGGGRSWRTTEDELIFDGTRGKVLSDHFGVRIVAELAP